MADGALSPRSGWTRRLTARLIRIVPLRTALSSLIRCFFGVGLSSCAIASLFCGRFRSQLRIMQLKIGVYRKFWTLSVSANTVSLERAKRRLTPDAKRCINTVGSIRWGNSTDSTQVVKGREGRLRGFTHDIARAREWRRFVGMKVERKCPVCGQTYFADKVRLRHGRQTTCSRKCSYKLRALTLSQSKPYRCAVCGKEVLRSPAQVKSRFVFCSRECHYHGRSMGFVRRVVTQPYKVSEEGRKAWRKAAKRREGIPRKEPVTWICEVCGTSRTIMRGEFAPARKLRFCSPECANKALRGVGNPSWRGGHPEYYGPDWRPLQRRARNLDGYVCQRCGVSQKDIAKALDVHHIQPVSSFSEVNNANRIENVVALCHDCHMLVEWNGIDFELPARFHGVYSMTRRVEDKVQQKDERDCSQRAERASSSG